MTLHLGDAEVSGIEGKESDTFQSSVTYPIGSNKPLPGRGPCLSFKNHNRDSSFE